MKTVRLVTRETFKVPDNCIMDIISLEVSNDVDNEKVKVTCLMIEDNPTERTKPIRRRFYPLSNVISFGDELNYLP